MEYSENAVKRNRNNKLNKVRTVMFVSDVAFLFVKVGIRPVIHDKKRYCLVNDIYNVRSNQIILPRPDRR